MELAEEMKDFVVKVIFQGNGQTVYVYVCVDVFVVFLCLCFLCFLCCLLFFWGGSLEERPRRIFVWAKPVICQTHAAKPSHAARKHL